MDFYDKVEELIKKDPRYKAEAYEFVMEAISFTQERLEREGHVTGKELLEGIKEMGLERFGAMAGTVFEHWGVKKTDDFGEIVFNMVKNELVKKTDKDLKKDFKNVYDFVEVFKFSP